MNRLNRFTAALIAAAIVFTTVAASLPVQATGHQTIQPGIRVSAGGGCTLGFALDGADGRTYFAWAAHCGDVGDQVSTSGVGVFGEVVYHDNFDFSLIQVYSTYDHLVSGEVKGHPGVPTGATQFSQTHHGDVVRFSGYGTGYSTTTFTQENRVGVMTRPAYNGEYCASGLVHWGDSGGPVMHDSTGTALGIVSRLGANCASSLTGPTLQGGMNRASNAGYDLTVKTA